MGRDGLTLGLVVGARPNFVKAAPLVRALRERNVRVRLIHTGQHYDAVMSDVFLKQLGLPRPDHHLRVGAGSHATQTARVMVRLEALLRRIRVDRLVVVGDVNSTLAAALVAAKLRIPVDHVEAGLRSGDRTMPEEINRIVTDRLSDRLFVTEPAGVRNLKQEGCDARSIHLVGNVMIDTLAHMLPLVRRRQYRRRLGLDRRGFGVVTLHRPSNVDDPDQLRRILEALEAAAQGTPLVFPVHPRTARRLPRRVAPTIRTLPPLSYVDFLSLVFDSRLVVTDSGGIQEEAAYLRIPCLTLRDTTERPITISSGTNTLVPTPDGLARPLRRILDGSYKRGRVPRLWDGRAAERIADVMARSL